jgi:hemoglobin-like flavoprotein
MALDAALLRESFSRMLELEPNLTARFYDVLFERYPVVRSMFHPSRRARQEQMLALALTAVVDHLDDAPWLEQTLRSLGQKHVGYGVTKEMYDWVGDALLTSMSEAMGEEWTPAHHGAWGAAYGAIVSLMRAGEGDSADTVRAAE